MSTAKKGDWVEIETVVLNPEERAPQLPEDTKATPLMMWTKGFLLDKAVKTGMEAVVRTLSGRTARGRLVAVNPRHVHDFGSPVPELLEIGAELREELEADK